MSSIMTGTSIMMGTSIILYPYHTSTMSAIMTGTSLILYPYHTSTMSSIITGTSIIPYPLSIHTLQLKPTHLHLTFETNTQLTPTQCDTFKDSKHTQTIEQPPGCTQRMELVPKLFVMVSSQQNSNEPAQHKTWTPA